MTHPMFVFQLLNKANILSVDFHNAFEDADIQFTTIEFRLEFDVRGLVLFTLLDRSEEFQTAPLRFNSIEFIGLDFLGHVVQTLG